MNYFFKKRDTLLLINLEGASRLISVIKVKKALEKCSLVFNSSECLNGPFNVDYKFDL